MDAAPRLEYVGFWPRVLASLLDGLFFAAISLPLVLVVFGPHGPDTAAPSSPAVIFINWVFPAAVTLGLWHRFQATPGKLALNARIVDADTGQAPRFHQWVLRYLGYLPAILALFLGVIWVGVDPRKQGWHDKLANTVVVRPARPAGLQATFRSARRG